MPRGHHASGAWRPVLQAGCSPLQALQIVRAHVREAGTKGIPWQRVFDAVRPIAATIWNGWTLRQRAQFLRHLRTLWDVHRHRMAGRIQGLEQKIGGVRAKVRFRQGDVSELNVAAVINCTGPQSDIRRSNQPLLQHLLNRNLVAPDTLGLGLESDDCVLNVNGFEPWLFALGALTRPAWWEITAVPEIRAQAERLARKIASNADETDDPLSAVFLDIGAGI